MKITLNQWKARIKKSGNCINMHCHECPVDLQCRPHRFADVNYLKASKMVYEELVNIDKNIKLIKSL